MKQILRIFSVVGVIALTALITAGSCDKPDDGDGITFEFLNKGTGVTTPAADAKDAAKTNITITTALFEEATAVAGDATDGLKEVAAATANVKKAFDIKIKDATAGMVVAAKGDVKIGAISTPAILATALEADKYKTGIHVLTGAANGGEILGGADAAAVTAAAKKVRIVSSFIDNDWGKSTGQPALFCVSKLENDLDKFVEASALKGGQTASCYVGTRGTTKVDNTWVTADPGGKGKTTITVTFAGINTGTKKASELGTEGADDAKKIEAFTGGLTTAEMAKVAGASPSGVQKFTITIAEKK